MCWCFPFGRSQPQRRSGPSSPDSSKRREKPPLVSLHGRGVPVVAAEAQEKRRSRDDTPRKRKSKDSVSSRSSAHETRDRLEPKPRHRPQHHDTHRTRDQRRPSVNVQVPDLWRRSVKPDSSLNSSEEMLLNPRPHRSHHRRQRHPKHTSQSTLRGRGAKRDPPRHSKSRGNLRQEPSKGWSLFAPPSPKTPSRRHRQYEVLDSTAPEPRTPRHHHHQQHQPHHPQQHHHHRASPQYPATAPSEPSLAQGHHHHQRSRQQDRQPTASRQARSRTPNTAARRTPDRRFAVLAATNQALEDLRREAFSQPSPPPRRERVQRYNGVAVPTSSIPFNWDCVSSSQTSAGYAESSTRHRRSRR